jgi:glycosyltransferase involved in cell wall biosynthesis
MNEISVWMQGFNEEKSLPLLLSRLKGLPDVVYVDHGSTDNSIKIAKSFGARVFSRKFIMDKATKDDVADFTQRFGYPPHFKAGDKFTLSYKERTECQKFCKNDWVLNLDCDEVLTWDYEKVKKLLPLYDVINCKFFHERNPDGSRRDWFQTSKLYNRKKTFWIGRNHEVINGYDIKVGWTNDMEIDHYQVPKESRKKIVNSMELSSLKEMDLRSFFYLGKEYHQYGEWEKAIKALTFYLKEGWYVAEKVKAYIMIAHSLWNLNRDDEAFIYACQALKLNPMSFEAYDFLAKISPRREQAIWKKHAELAVNDHLV